MKYLTKLDSWARTSLRKHPRLREFIIPCWKLYRDFRWWRFLLRGQSVRITVHTTEIKFQPEGQIARLVWESNFEAYERDFVETYLQPGMHVLNIGANVGLYTLIASTLVGLSGEVYAFEPSSTSYARLLKNVEINRCRNVVTKRVAVSNIQGQLLLRADPRAPDLDGHRFVERLTADTKVIDSDEIVETMTLDGYLKSLDGGDLSKINFIVMDVEGAEFDVLDGARQMLSKSDPTILFECSKRPDSVEALLRELGYRIWSWNLELRRLEPAQIQDQAMLHNIIARRESWEAPKSPRGISISKTKKDDC